MRMAKTDQAARMRSSCCRNTSAQFYRGTHVYAHINKCYWNMRSLNGAYIDRLLDNPGNMLEGDVSDVIALDQLTSPFSPRKATRMSP